MRVDDYPGVIDSPKFSTTHLFDGCLKTDDEQKCCYHSVDRIFPIEMWLSMDMMEVNTVQLLLRDNRQKVGKSESVF